MMLAERFCAHQNPRPAGIRARLQAGLEGTVSKWRRNSPYRLGRSPHWIKRKNSIAPAVKREAEDD
jgi:ATP-dependent DNA ligase